MEVENCKIDKWGINKTRAHVCPAWTNGYAISLSTGKFYFYTIFKSPELAAIWSEGFWAMIGRVQIRVVGLNPAANCAMSIIHTIYWMVKTNCAGSAALKKYSSVSVGFQCFVFAKVIRRVERKELCDDKHNGRDQMNLKTLEDATPLVIRNATCNMRDARRMQCHLVRKIKLSDSFAAKSRCFETWPGGSRGTVGSLPSLQIPCRFCTRALFVFSVWALMTTVGVHAAPSAPPA